jgi:N-acetylneuraminic acid mutarotase
MLTLIDLPEECVLAILSWLPLPGLLSCCVVSRELKRLARDPSLWKGLFIESKSTQGAPDARLWCSSVVFQGKLFVYGGHTTQGVTSNLINNVKSDFYYHDVATKKWAQIEHSMGGKTEHKCVVYENSLWFVGGYNGYDYTSDIFKFDPSTGTSAVIETTGESFSRRSALTALVWEDKLYTFGGWNGFSRTWYNDLHVFDFKTRHWRAIHPKGPVPTKRTSHSAVIYNNKMYVFGGFSGEEYLNDLFELDLQTETWTEITSLYKGDIPAARSRFCAAVHENCMYILGGWNKVGYFNDFYMYNFDTRVWSNVTNSNFTIPCISQYSLATDGNFFYVFGGFCANEKTCINKLYLHKLEETEKDFDCMSVMPSTQAS